MTESIKPGDAFLADEAIYPTDPRFEKLVDVSSVDEARRKLGMSDEPGHQEKSPRKSARDEAHNNYERLYNLTGPRTEQEAKAASDAAQLGRPAVEEAIRVAREGNSNREQ